MIDVKLTCDSIKEKYFQISPSPSKRSGVISHSTFQRALTKSDCSQRQMLSIAQELRKDVKVEPYLGRAFAEANQRFADLFITEDVTAPGDNTTVPLVYCSDVETLVARVLNKRGIGSTGAFLRMSIDEGQSFLKVTVSIINEESGNDHNYKASGARRTMILAITPLKETYDSVALVMSKLQIDQLSPELKVIFSQDLKMFNLALGIGTHTSSFPCHLCLWPNGK